VAQLRPIGPLSQSLEIASRPGKGQFCRRKGERVAARRSILPYEDPGPDHADTAPGKLQFVATMNFEWNEQKRATNLRKHEIDFVHASMIFDGWTKTMPDKAATSAKSAS